MISMAEFTEPKTVNCPDCESARVVKIGTRNGYQRYLCRACSKKFHTNGKAAGRRFPADQMGAAIRLFYSGMSYKQIAESMGKMYDISEPSKATIYQWVRDYTKDALKEMERHPAHTGGRWVVDKMQLDVGGQKYWIWNVMDGSSRYLLASHLTKDRNAGSAEAVLKKAAAAAAEPPRTVRTDRWPYYVLSVKQIFPDARHLRLVGVGNREDIKNPSKRVQGLFRQRTKTLRGFGSKEKGQLYLDGWTLDYTLFRDHESMDGEPPGQAAKVNPPFNEWTDVVTGRAHTKNAGPAVRVGATSDRAEIPPGVDVAREVDSYAVPKREPPDRWDVAQDVHSYPVPKRKPIPDRWDVAQEVYSDPVPKRKPIPDGAEVAGKVDSDYRFKRPRGRRKIPPALKPKSGYKPRSPGHQGSKSRATAPLKIGTFAPQVKKG